RPLGRGRVDRRAGEDPLHRHLEFLVRQCPRYGPDLINLVGYVPRRKGGAQFARNARPQIVIQAYAISQYDKQQQLAGSALGVLEVHHDRVDDVVQTLDHGVELAGPESHTTPVEGGVGAPGDHAGAPVADGDPVTVAPDAGVHVEVRVPVAGAVGVAP